MSSLKLPMWTFVAVGAITFLLLQLHFSLTWDSFYVNYPWPGYAHAMRNGNVPAFFSTSTLSLRVTRIVLFVLPLFSLWFAGRQSWKAATRIWFGVMIAVILIWFTSGELREDSNMWPIDLVFLSYLTALPIFLGTFTMRIIQEITTHFRRSR